MHQTKNIALDEASRGSAQKKTKDQQVYKIKQAIQDS
jgi:hypothetical protein